MTIIEKSTLRKKSVPTLFQADAALLVQGVSTTSSSLRDQAIASTQLVRQV